MPGLIIDPGAGLARGPTGTSYNLRYNLQPCTSDTSNPRSTLDPQHTDSALVVEAEGVGEAEGVLCSPGRCRSNQGRRNSAENHHPRHRHRRHRRHRA